MTTISKEDVVRLAALSNVTLQEDELEGLAKDIKAILKYIAQLDELNTDGVEPTYQVTGLVNGGREDTVIEGVPPEALLDLAPASHEHQIKVPKVL
jgi:aspartyl-tRNA(Asn)/glutamyl-tRNA(Gln) amidotransferase subunit C